MQGCASQTRQQKVNSRNQDNKDGDEDKDDEVQPPEALAVTLKGTLLATGSGGNMLAGRDVVLVRHGDGL